MDGDVSEYPEVHDIYSVGGLKFAEMAFAHDGTNLYVHMKSLGLGWVGFGQGENGMLGANMIIYQEISGEFNATDYQGSMLGNIFPNQDASANYSVIDFFGSQDESAHTTTVEFSIPLVGDAQDEIWEVGEAYGFFMAAHNESNTLKYHTWHTARNLRVTLLNSSFAAPATVNLSALTATENDDNITFSTTATSNLAFVQGLTIDFVAEKRFGTLLLGSAITDAGGDASFTLNKTYFDSFVGSNATIIAEFTGAPGFSAASTSETITINGHDITEFYEENILDPLEADEFLIDPDLFDNSQRLLGAIFLYVLVIIIFLLVWEYVKAVIYLALIRQEGSKEDN